MFGSDGLPVDGPDTNLSAGQNAPRMPHAPTRTSSQSLFTRITSYLQDLTRIDCYVHHPKYRRYADLRRNEMFTNLVDMYTIVFKTFWNHLGRFIETADIPIEYADQPQRFASAVYISSWFHDLYVSNRIACRKLSDSAYIEHYYMDLVHKSTKYDVFLTRLNAHIRPTNVKLTDKDTLFIPRIFSALNSEAQNENYFSINGWRIDDPILHGILHTMEERRIFNVEELAETTLGRPSWLFDWQTDGLIYAWFRSEGNYTFDDVAAAYIIGTACTPKLGPRDYDEWRLLPGNVHHTHPEHLNLRRIRSLTYHGQVEIRVYETRTWTLPPEYQNHIQLAETQSSLEAPATQTGPGESRAPRAPAQKKQKSAPPRPIFTYPLHRVTRSGTHACQSSHPQNQEEEEDSDEAQEEEEAESQPNPTQLTGQVNNVTYTVHVPQYHQVRIVDYLYHARVANLVDLNTRMAALRQLIYQLK